MDFFEFLFGKKEEKTPEKASSETSQIEKVAPPPTCTTESFNFFYH